MRLDLNSAIDVERLSKEMGSMGHEKLCNACMDAAHAKIDKRSTELSQTKW